MTKRYSDCFYIGRINAIKYQVQCSGLQIFVGNLYFVKTEFCFMVISGLSLNFPFALHILWLKRHFCIIHLNIIIRERSTVLNIVTTPTAEAGVVWI